MPNQIAFYPQSGGAGSLTLIQSQILASPASSVTFSAISQNYTHLKLIISASSSASATFDSVQAQFNGDTASNYIWQELFVSGTSPSGATPGTSTSITLGNVAATTSPVISGGIDVTIPNYQGTVFDKTASALSGSATSATALTIIYAVGAWKSTAAISSIKLLLATGPNFVTGSTFSLYGLQ